MIPLSKLSLEVRKVGLNYGIPMTTITLGIGDEVTVDGLLEKIFNFPGGNWVCIRGEDTTQSGIGTLVKNLSKIGIFVEIENQGENPEPKWIHTVDRWLVTFSPKSPFNYFALRQQDMVLIDMARFSVQEGRQILDLLKPFSGTKCILVQSEKDLKNPDILDLSRIQDRCRVYVK